MSDPAPGSVDVAVIGSGPGGLATAAELIALGVKRTIVFESGPAVAWKWHMTYDGLRLNSAAWTSALPDFRWPVRAGRWPSREAIIRYYSNFAASRRIPLALSSPVESVIRRGELWALSHPAGECRARVVVVATGRHRIPHLPAWPGLSHFRGQFLHASDYHRPADIERPVVVVGGGNSAVDIACELAAFDGTSPVVLAVRGTPTFIPRSVAGIPYDLYGPVAEHTPDSVTDALVNLAQRSIYRRLAGIGSVAPSGSFVGHIRVEGQLPVVETGEFRKHVRAARVVPSQPVARFSPTGVVLTDGAVHEAASVIAATGYRAGLGSLMGEELSVDKSGCPIMSPTREVDGYPGVFFVGYQLVVSGYLRHIAREGVETAGHIAALLASGAAATTATPGSRASDQ